jgi:hypothetical protein
VLTESQNTVYERIAAQAGNGGGDDNRHQEFHMHGVSNPETAARRAAALATASRTLTTGMDFRRFSSLCHS